MANRKKDKDATSTPKKAGGNRGPDEHEHTSPVMLRAGLLMLLTAFKVCEITEKDFKEEVIKVLDDLKGIISEPGTIDKLRKVLKI